MSGNVLSFKLHQQQSDKLFCMLYEEVNVLFIL